MYGPFNLAAKLLWPFGISASFRGEAAARVSWAGNGCALGVRWWCGDGVAVGRPMEGRGDADKLGVRYGLPQLMGSVGDKPAGDKAFGERRPKEPILVMLLAVRLLV